MSDYQTVTVKARDKAAVTIARRGIDDGKQSADKQDWVKIGAMLLFGEKAMSGDVEAPEDGTPDPGDFVADVVTLEATTIGEGDSKNPIYRAQLRVVLKKAKHAKLFEVGESFGAVADLGGDVEEIFG